MTHHTYAYNSQNIFRDGEPWLPAMGEIHFSRCRPQDWRDSVRLMKSGGIDIVSTYIFWNHHEAEPGKFDFSGCRDIGAFLDICEGEDMPVFFRFGPWCHGEAKNGGFPDWLMKSGVSLRSDDPGYLKLVRRYWEALYEQVKRHIGGCVIGLQYENEFHGPDAHISSLVALSREIGFDAPFITATGWGSAAIGECLPVMGGYVDAPWDRRLDKLPPNGNYLFTRTRDDNNIGSDLSGGNVIYPPRFDDSGYPYLTAELGGGNQPTYHRRPVISARDTGAMLNVKLGQGTVLPGFYMYHGGTNPGFDLHESKASGYPNDVPELNYDFQAPIGEYGKPSEAYFELRRFFTFLRDFGSELAVMRPSFPDDNPVDPGDLDHLRYCLRTDGESGYLFVNDYIRGYNMKEHTRTFRVRAGEKDIIFPEMTFRDGDSGFYPFNLRMGNGKLVSSNAAPLCVLNGKTYVFYTDADPVYNTEGDVSDIDIVTLTQAESLAASKVTVNGRDYLIICDAPYTRDGDDLIFMLEKETPLKVYPSPDVGSGFAHYILACPADTVKAEISLISENPLMKEYSITVGEKPEAADDLILSVDYDGNIAELFIGGVKAADQYCLGNGWRIGLKRFEGRRDFTLRIFALPENAPVYVEWTPEYKNGFACSLKGISVSPEYRVRFSGLGRRHA